MKKKQQKEKLRDKNKQLQQLLTLQYIKATAKQNTHRKVCCVVVVVVTLTQLPNYWPRNFIFVDFSASFLEKGDFY